MCCCHDQGVVIVCERNKQSCACRTVRTPFITRCLWSFLLGVTAGSLYIVDACTISFKIKSTQVQNQQWHVESPLAQMGGTLSTRARLCMANCVAKTFVLCGASHLVNLGRSILQLPGWTQFLLGPWACCPTSMNSTCCCLPPKLMIYATYLVWSASNAARSTSHSSNGNTATLSRPKTLQAYLLQASR